MAVEVSKDGTAYVYGIAYEDQHHEGADLKQAARDAMIRHARHLDVHLDDVRPFYGERWRPQQPGDSHNEMMIPGMVPENVYGWRWSGRVVACRLDGERRWQHLWNDAG